MIDHVSEIHSTWAGYSARCSCGIESRFFDTRAQAQREKAKHLDKVENHYYWWIIREGETSRPFSTRRTALDFLGVPTATKVRAGTYATGDVIITTHPEEQE